MLGQYRLVRRIGSGGMGEVYLAEDTRLNRRVAIKVVRTETEPYPDPVARQETVRRFKREMRAITMLDHPHILSLLDFGEESDGNMVLTYMVMPYRQEGSLIDWLHQQRTDELTLDEVAYFIMQAADALQHAHEHDLVHQDVKPSNFLVRKRSGNLLPDLLLMDFGISKITTATVTASRSIRGTPAYMAPEQWRGQPEPATDQYALAVMAYLLLTHRTPFLGSMEQVMHQHLLDRPQPPSTFNRAISPALDAVILSALDKQPGKRFPSVLGFAMAFQQAVESSGNENPTVVATKRAPDDSAPLPPQSSGNYTRLSETVPSAPPFDTDLLAQAPTVRSSELSNPDWGIPIPPPPPVTGQNLGSTKKAGWRLPVIVALTILIILSSVVGVGLLTFQNQVRQMNASATATADTQINATATAQAIADNPYPSYLPGKGTLAFVDPLSQEAHWHPGSDARQSGQPPYEECSFARNAYHVVEQDNKYYMHCAADGTFDNFAFEVQLTIVQGDCGGVVVRKEDKLRYYYFEICQNGTFALRKYVDSSPSTIMFTGNSSAIRIGNQNKLAVLASGNTMTFYVNEQQVDQEQDSSYSSGNIELIASPYYGTGSTTDVAYTNARLWQ